MGTKGRVMRQWINGTLSPPCDGCSLAQHCADSEVACERFRRFVEYQTPKSQMRKAMWWRAVHEPREPWVYEPTRAIYDRLFALEPIEGVRGVGRPRKFG